MIPSPPCKGGPFALESEAPMAPPCENGAQLRLIVTYDRQGAATGYHIGVHATSDGVTIASGDCWTEGLTLRALDKRLSELVVAWMVMDTAEDSDTLLDQLSLF